jgi:predicted DCC family thiol-disulfide oxidoreductase YuxK
MDQLPTNKIIVLFDGDCGLCNQAIQILLQEDPSDQFRFVSQQAALGKSILAHIGYNPNTLDSLVVYHPNVAYYTQSQAVFYLCKHGSYKLKLLLVFQLFPKVMLDAVYNWIAKNRHRWFGKNKHCLFPNERHSVKFLS